MDMLRRDTAKRYKQIRLLLKGNMPDDEPLQHEKVDDVLLIMGVLVIVAVIVRVLI